MVVDSERFKWNLLNCQLSSSLSSSEQALMSSTNFCHGQINKHASEGTEKTTK